MTKEVLYAILDQHEYDLLKAELHEKHVDNKKTIKIDSVKKGFEMSIDLGIDDESIDSSGAEVKDVGKFAVKFGIIGVGQAGNNLAQSFWDRGYRKVAIVNSTARDMQRLSIPEKNRHVLKSDGGAGKDPAVGKKLIESEKEEIIALIRNCLGTDVEQILILVSGGGGTGCGAALPMVDICKQYMKSIGIDSDKRVGVMFAMPTKDESSASQKNAYSCLNDLVSLAESGSISPLVLMDNSRVLSLYGKASVTDVWTKANKNAVSLFSSFNELSALDGPEVHMTCDPQDYKSVLRGGILVFGRTKVEKVEKVTDIADAVRDNLKKGLLVEGLDLSKAKVGAAILVGSSDALSSVSQEALEAAFGSLNRMMDQGGETKLHRGLYELDGSPLFVFTLLSGLGAPELRMQEMANKGGL